MDKLRSNYLILFIILSGPNALMHFYTLINSGESAVRFININFAATHRFPI